MSTPGKHRVGGMRLVRTWLPVAIIVSGLILMAIVRDENGLEGGVLLISAGLSVWLLNWFYRVGVSGDRDRVTEDRARAYFDEHGYWPDEAPPEQSGALTDDDERTRRDPHRRAPAQHRPDRPPGSRPRRPRS
jgi:hypothetical protein